MEAIENQTKIISEAVAQQDEEQRGSGSLLSSGGGERGESSSVAKKVSLSSKNTSPSPSAKPKTFSTVAVSVEPIDLSEQPNFASRQPDDAQCGSSSAVASHAGNPPHGKQRSLEGNLVDSTEITTIRELTSEQSTSVSGVLRFCKQRILFPYLKLLGVMGLKPLHSDTDEAGICLLLLSKLYLVVVGFILLLGYFLQFMTCFRRDHGFCYKIECDNPPYSVTLHEAANQGLSPADAIRKLQLSSSHNVSVYPNHFLQKHNQKWLLENTICHGNVTYTYFIPAAFHFLAFIYMVYLYWLNDDEHLQNLMERVFIQAAHANINVFSQKRLIRRMQGLVGIGCLWIILMTSIQTLHVLLHHLCINFWVDADPTSTGTISGLLLFTTLWQDAIQITVVVSFGIHCHLISTYTELIRARLMQHSISLSDCLKELGELVQLLQYLNDDLAPGLAPLLLIDGLYAGGTIVNLIQKGKTLSLLNFMTLLCVAGLWIFIVFFPLLLAARLSTCCQKLKEMGHSVRIRPFGYQYVSQFNLDSFLLFISNIKLTPKILKVPVTSAAVSVLSIFLLMIIIIWGYFQ